MRVDSRFILDEDGSSGMNYARRPAMQRKRHSRKRIADRQDLPDPSSIAHPDEVSAAVSGHIGRCVARAVEHATMLESIGSQAFTAVGELTRSAPPDDLVQKAHALRGLVLHGLAVLAELQSVAGALAAVAAVRQAHESEPGR
jgi:hypothetical protein